jgi:hypothetical protein
MNSATDKDLMWAAFRIVSLSAIVSMIGYRMVRFSDSGILQKSLLRMNAFSYQDINIFVDTPRASATDPGQMDSGFVLTSVSVVVCFCRYLLLLQGDQGRWTAT